MAPESQTLASTEPPAAGLSRIYIYRPGTPIGVVLRPQVEINGVVIGRLPANAAIYRDVPPGRYELVAELRSRRTEPMVVEARAGETVYARLTPRFGLFTDSIRIRPADPETAADELQNVAVLGGRAWSSPQGTEVADSRPAGAAAANAGPVPFRCPAPGTRIVTSTGALSFVEGDGYVCRFVNSAGQEAARFAAFWAADGRWTQERPDSITALWPLEVGKSVEFSEAVNGEAWTYSYEVVGRESIEVPAGRFDTLVVDYAAYPSGGEKSDAVVERRYWYAPDVGYFIRTQWLEGSAEERQSAEDWQARIVTLPSRSLAAPSAGS